MTGGADIVADLRAKALDLHREAWRAFDGGQELTSEALEIERQADALEAALAAQETPHA